MTATTAPFLKEKKTVVGSIFYNLKELEKIFVIFGTLYAQWLKWFCEAGGGAHLTKPGWSKPHTHSNPTNFALFGHKITFYRFNQGGSYYCRGGSNGSRGLSPRASPTGFSLSPARQSGERCKLSKLVAGCMSCH